MAEDDQSSDESQKTEEPTARKLEEARKRGQVVLSREINNWVMLFAATLILVVGGPAIMSQLKDTLTIFIAQPDNLRTDPGALLDMSENLVISVGKTLMLPFLLLLAAAILAPLLQIGPLLSFEPLKPEISKISLLGGVKRLFSLRAIMEFVKGLAKLTIVFVVGVLVLKPYFAGLSHFTGLDMHQALFELQTMTTHMLVGVLSVLFIVAVLDYLYQRYDFYKKLRMSKQEMKDEYKQTEGDPHIKARLRELRESKARQRMMQNVPEADVVITNPTHFAVALKYETGKMDAPVMVAKGNDAVAERIKDVAREYEIPIIENAPLARALYDSMEIDQMIPQEHYKAVAEVISYIFKLKRGQR